MIEVVVIYTVALIGVITLILQIALACHSVGIMNDCYNFPFLVYIYSLSSS